MSNFGFINKRSSGQLRKTNKVNVYIQARLLFRKYIGLWLAGVEDTLVSDLITVFMLDMVL